MPPGRCDQSDAAQQWQHEDEEAGASCEPPPCRNRVERKAFPKRQKNESSFQDIQGRGSKAGIWTVAQRMQAPMRHQRVGNTRANERSQRTNCRWFSQMADNGKPTGDASEAHAPQQERQPYGE